MRADRYAVAYRQLYRELLDQFAARHATADARRPQPPVILALAAALCWGLADFMGAVSTRRVGLLLTMCTGQVVTLAVLASSPPGWAVAAFTCRGPILPPWC